MVNLESRGMGAKIDPKLLQPATGWLRLDSITAIASLLGKTVAKITLDQLQH